MAIRYWYLFIRSFLLLPDLLPKCLELSLYGDPDVFKALGEVITKRTCPMNTLKLKCLSREGDAILVFMGALQSSPHQTPKLIDIGQPMYLSSDAIIAISTLLQNQECKIEGLVLRQTRIYDESLAQISLSLQKNVTLREFIVDTKSLTNTGWDIMSSLVCNTSSINSTYSSNHTLYKFGPNISKRVQFDLRADFKFYRSLKMNELADKKIVARMKVVENHFARNLNFDPFIDMQPTLVVHLLRCMHETIEAIHEQRSSYDDENMRGENNCLTIYYLLLRGNQAMVACMKPKSGTKRPRTERS